MALAGRDATFMADDIASTKGTATLDVFLVMAIALSILATAEALDGGGDAHLGMVVLGFILFNTFMNARPNATTYALPAEVFPSEVRAAGHGFAAASAKLGAALGVFLFPILIDDIGTSALLFVISGTSLVGFAVTYVLRIEPRGRSLDEVSGASIAAIAPRPAPP